MYNKEVVWAEERNEWCTALVDGQTGEIVEYISIEGQMDDIYGRFKDQELING